jgi:hypothetical protein
MKWKYVFYTVTEVLIGRNDLNRNRLQTSFVWSSEHEIDFQVSVC